MSRYDDVEKLHLFLDFLGLSLKRRKKLLERYSEEELIPLIRDRSAALAPFLDEKLAELAEARRNFPNFLASLEAEDIRAVCLRSESYPEFLRHIGEPPFVLYAKGDLGLMRGRCLAIVGRRHCRKKSLETTKRFAGRLAAAGLVIVSGLAEGCDTAAHEGALESGKTIAVLAGGFHHVYPQINAGLFARIEREGLVLSESRPDLTPRRFDFLGRNRIVAGLSEGTLVTCAGESSGTLSTANAALNSGRELFVIPGDIDLEDHVGTNRLIRDAQGALVTCPEDILETLGIGCAREKNCDAAAEITIGESESCVLGVLKEDELHINEIAAGMSMPFAELAPLLTVMEIEGLVERLPANMWRKKLRRN